MSFFGLIWILVFFFIVLSVLGSIAKKFSSSSPSSGGKWLKNPAGLFNTAARNEAWMRTAGELGLSYIRPKQAGDPPEISGHADRLDISARCAPGENGFAPETVYQVKLNPPLKIGLLIMKDRPEEIRRNFSGRRRHDSLVEILPDAGMESAVSAYEEQALNDYLTPERAQFVSDSVGEFPRFRIDDNALTVRYPGIERDADRFIARFRRIIALAKRLSEKKTAEVKSEARPISVTPLDPMPHIDDLELKRKLSRKMAEEPKSPPAPVPEPVIQAEPEPVPPKQDPAPIPAPVEEKPEIAAETDPDAMPSKEQLLISLWHSPSVGPKEKELFEKYKGRSVQWDGVLKTAYDFSTDFVFGSGGGVKATLEIFELTSGGSMLRTKIKAVVHFPKEDAALLKAASGKTVRFQGSLLKMEPFARELYLSDGKVIRVES